MPFFGSKGLGVLVAVALTAPLYAAVPLTATDTTAVQECFRQSYKAEAAGQYQDAIKALQSVPKSYVVEYRTAWLSYQNKDYVGAETHYQAALKVAPESLEARVGSLLPLLAQQRYADVETAARQILRTDPNNYTAALRLSVALRWQGKFPQAEEIATRLSNLYPTDTSFLLELAYAKWGQGLKPAAKALFNKILILDPDNATAKDALKQL